MSAPIEDPRVMAPGTTRLVHPATVRVAAFLQARRNLGLEVGTLANVTQGAERAWLHEADLRSLLERIERLEFDYARATGTSYRFAG